MTRMVEVRTPGRLHFGLTCFGGEGRQFGGLGAMVDGVGVTLRISPEHEFVAAGPLSDRVEKFAQRVVSRLGLASLPVCRIEVVESSAEHTGLGVGTQLGLAVAAGLLEWSTVEWRDAKLLSQISGRGKRSAIGTHGFLQGGLLFDEGKLASEPLGKLAARLEIPSAWRFVLIRPTAARGLAGHAEKNAFTTLPPVPATVTRQLHELVNEEIIPATRAADWKSFSEALYDYGYRAGECFAASQGGPFASREIESLVNSVRDLGYPGVGQSSWGPTVFAVAENEESGNELVDRLKSRQDYQTCHYAICPPNNHGMRMETG